MHVYIDVVVAIK